MRKSTKRDSRGRFVFGSTSPRKGIFNTRRNLVCEVCANPYFTYHKVSHTCSRKCRKERLNFWEKGRTEYRKLHHRVEYKRGKPNKCEFCGFIGKCEWANRSGNYLNINDYLRLCKECHKNFDRGRRKDKYESNYQSI